MDVSDLAVKLLILFFPGLVCAYIVETLTVHPRKDITFFLLKSYIYGMSSYFIYWVAVKVLETYCGSKVFSTTFLQTLTVKDAPLSLREISFASVISVCLGLIISIVINRKLLFRFMQWACVTKKFGEQDVWEFTFNSNDINWVTVRDLNNNLVYDGWVQAFSDTSADAELLIRDVSIYKNDSAEPLYQVGALYVSRNRADMTIEFRDIPISTEIEWKEQA